MQNHAVHQGADFLGRAALRLDRFLIDADLIWRHQAVVRCALCQGHAMIEAQQLEFGAHTSHSHGVPCGPLFDDNLHIVECLVEHLGHRFQCFEHKPFELIDIHVEGHLPT